MSESAPNSSPRGTLLGYARVYIAWLVLALVCLSWSVIALPAYLMLPARSGASFGRWGISAGFRLFVGVLQWLGVYRFDLKAINHLRQESSVILAPNHPRLIDALVLLAYHPNMICVMKAELASNVFLGAGSRLARYIRNSPPRGMIRQAIGALHDGGALLLFPEGTRSVRVPVNAFQLTVGAIAKHAKVPVQTVLIETDSPYLSKGWPALRVPGLPMAYSIRLGRRFNPPTNAQQFSKELEAYFCRELSVAPQAACLEDSKAITVG